MAGLVIVGASALVSVKACEVVPDALVGGEGERIAAPAAAAGVPAMVAVPSPLSVKVRPAGRAPDSVRAGAGSPVVVTREAERRAHDRSGRAPALVKAGATFSVEGLGGAGAEVDPVRELPAVGAGRRPRR